MHRPAPPEPLPDAEVILSFWFAGPPRTAEELARRMSRWFGSSREWDLEIGAKFGPVVRAAASGALEDWPRRARGCLALLILLDQFPRNIHRGTAAAFEHDSRARELTRRGVAAGLDQELEPLERMFFYLPLAHSESIEDQQDSVALTESLPELAGEAYLRKALEGAADYARQHRDIIARFGRFPHRNAVLGRSSTAQELSYLERGGPSFGQGQSSQASTAS